MHIVKFDQRFGPQFPSDAGLDRHHADSMAKLRAKLQPKLRAKLRPDLYGHRRQFLQLGFALMMASTVFQGGPAVASAPLKIIAFGDSLTAGYKLPADEAFPAVLEKALKARGFDVTIVNAGVSGETAEDGLARFDWTFADGADGAILELGANDMLRGFDPKLTRQTLDTILGRLKARKIPVLIAGMLASPSLGVEYQETFDKIFEDLAHKYDAPLYPFFLKDVMNSPTLQLADGLHPNREGVEKIVENMLPSVEPFIKRLSNRS
jgi:acyl-CoA thioesterase-1